MALETRSLDRINRQFREMNAVAPNMYWQHGTLWIDTNDKAHLTIIKDAMLEDVLDIKYTVKFNLLKLKLSCSRCR